MRILIVEDKREMAQMLKSAIEEKGHATALAFTGRQGLDQAMAGGFDVVVLDLMLPDVDGYAVAKKLREAPATPCRS